MEKLRPVFMAVFVACCYQIAQSSEPPLAPALYVIGDSLLDSGNNNLLPTFARANFFPYGSVFAAGATGRFTNGKTVADFVAEALGLPFPPPYLSLRGSTPLTGLNYASASCGILRETGNDLGKCLSIAEQVDMFNQTVHMELSRHYNTSELSDHLSKSIFLVAIGNNDYINNYLQPNFYNTSRTYSPTSFAKLVVDALSVQFQRLYDLGARKVVMFEIGPIGCIPLFTKKTKRTNNETCVVDYNQLAMMFNDQLDAMLKNLTTTLHDSQFILGHCHWLGYDIAINPAAYGLTDSSNPCCLTWDGASACIPETIACRDDDKHYFWDGYHGTEAFYRIVATRCINGTDVCLPKNIMDLVRS
nr:GDSL esterase/lipase 7-like [Ipomoea batatas]